MEMALVDSDFVEGLDLVNGGDGLDSVLMAVVVLMLSVRPCLWMLRRLRLGGSDSRVFAVMFDIT